MKTLCIFLVLFSPIIPALAIDFYDAEIIIFTQSDSQGDDETLDTPNEHHIDLQLELKRLLDMKPVVYLEPAIDGYLIELSNRLKVSNDYDILFHGRWSQTTANQKSSPYVLIHLPAVSKQLSLTGVLRLFSTDLLYIDVLARYQPATVISNRQKQNLKQSKNRPFYFIKERRRIKFGEIHFIDHPKFGVIVTVSPITIEK